MVTVSELIEMLANIDGNKEVKIVFASLDEENTVFNGRVDYTDEDREEVTIYVIRRINYVKPALV
ncbi:hypothetical protein [Fusobacterium sp. SYSU M8D902]|uniref:hypothetical protein n=1 Tax=Fusobacterium sp. SYSU M8D902 TaxID=3159562 RepID=UPI0032E39156